MLRSLIIVLAISGVVVVSVAAGLAGDVPQDANGAPKDIPKDQEPALGWSFRNLEPEQQQRMLRFSTFVNQGIPEAYLKTENTVGYTVRAIAEGGPLYVVHCQKCHGETGLGNGDLAYALTPSPALLAYIVQQPIAVDQYLLWSIAEGGTQFATAMPAFKSELTETQIWQIIAYLRAGFPALEETDDGVRNGGAAKTDEPALEPQTVD